MYSKETNMIFVKNQAIPVNDFFVVVNDKFYYNHFTWIDDSDKTIQNVFRKYQDSFTKKLVVTDYLITFKQNIKKIVDNKVLLMCYMNPSVILTDEQAAHLISTLQTL